MAAYRVYEAKFPFMAREVSELTISEGDRVRVYEKPDGGGWPDPAKWMRGENESTEETGDFPGTYCSFLDEVAPPPLPLERTRSPLPATPNGEAPPVPPRRG